MGDPRGCPADGEGGDGQAELVDQVGGQQLTVERRATLRDDDPRPRVADLRERVGKLHPTRAGGDELSDRFEGATTVGRRVGGRHDERRRLGGGEQLQARVEVQARGHDRQPGHLGLPPSHALRPQVLWRAGRAVALGPDRARGGQHDVGHRPDGREHLAVGRAAERSGAAVDRGPAVGGGHHVHEHPRPARRWRPVDLRVGTVDRDVVGRLGEQHPHGSGPYRRGTMPAVETRTAFRTCPLCEAGCGLEITLKDEAVSRIRGDRDDVFSHGFICPKGSTLKQLHEDPDRLRTPLVKRDGVFVEATWDDAFEEIERRLTAVVDAHGRNAVAVYLGNPNAHTLAGQLYARPLIRALGTTNVYSASTVDQRPKELSAGMMFGPGLIVPVPDVDRTDHLLVLGANPYASNGSLATAPDWPGRIEALRARGGRMVVVDPRRSRTAEEADEWVPIRPGTDGLLLAAMVRTLVDEGLVDVGDVEPYVDGLDQLDEVLAPFGPDDVADATGIDAEVIRRLARELAAAPTAVVYGRIGTTTAEFGTITSWLVDVLNICTGNLDRPGGAMFTRAAVGASNTRGAPRHGRAVSIGRRRSRVRGMGETLGELPVVCLAEEMDTPGDGQVKAFFCLAGNPVLSTPNGGRLDAALDGLELMVAVDIYVNETSRHADVIL